MSNEITLVWFQDPNGFFGEDNGWVGLYLNGALYHAYNCSEVDAGVENIFLDLFESCGVSVLNEEAKDGHGVTSCGDVPEQLSSVSLVGK